MTHYSSQAIGIWLMIIIMYAFASVIVGIEWYEDLRDYPKWAFPMHLIIGLSTIAGLLYMLFAFLVGTYQIIAGI